jgi:hypothetical protein
MRESRGADRARERKRSHGAGRGHGAAVGRAVGHGILPSESMLGTLSLSKCQSGTAEQQVTTLLGANVTARMVSQYTHTHTHTHTRARKLPLMTSKIGR